jgi:hypothetical protein
MAPAVAAVETLGTVATLAVGADADSRRHQTPLEDDRVRALEVKVTALETQLRQTADSLRQKRQAYRADADAWGKKNLSLVNLNVGLKDECAGLTDEIAGLKLRLQILAGEAASATASGNGTEIRCLQPTSLAALEMAALKDEVMARTAQLRQTEVELRQTLKAFEEETYYSAERERNLEDENDALKERLEDIADLLDGDPKDYYLGLDAGGTNKANDAEAAADVDKVEAGEANEEEEADAAAEVVDMDADEADEAYLREMEAYY